MIEEEQNLIHRYTKGATDASEELIYKEYLDKEKGEYIITATLTYKTTSKSAINTIKKSWEKDKSPLLTILHRIRCRHAQDVKDGKENKWYNVEDIEKLK